MESHSRRGDAPYRTVRLCAWVLVVIGTAGLAGWAFAVPALKGAVPGMAIMKANTALCFFVSGLALFSVGSPRSERSRWLGLACATLVLLIGAMTSAEDLTDIDLGLDQWLFRVQESATGVHPGRMSPVTAIGFQLTGLALWLQAYARHDRRLRVAARVLAGALCLITTVALLGYAIDLDVLYDWPAFRTVAFSTALGLAVLATGLLALSADGTLSDHVRLTRLAVVLLALVAGATGIAGAAVVEREARRALGEGLKLAFESRVKQFTTSIDLHGTRAQIIASRPNMLKHLRLQQSAPNSAEHRAVLRGVLQSFTAHGFSALAIYSDAAEPIASTGSPVAVADMTVPLDASGEALLLWHDGFHLRHRLPLRDAQGTLGVVVAEQPMMGLTEALFESASPGASGEFLLCRPLPQESLDCFPTRLRPEPFTIAPDFPGAPQLLKQALTEGSGSGTALDHAGRRLIGAFGPAGNTGLLAVLSIDSAELYGRLRERFVWLGLLIVSLTAIGGWIMRSRLDPLAAALEKRVEQRTAALAKAMAELRESEERFRLMVTGVKDYAIFMLDPDGCIVTWNDGARLLKGYSAEEIIGTHFSRFYRPEDIAQGRPERELAEARDVGCVENETWRVRKDGSLFWAAVVVTAVHGEDGQLRGYCKVVRDLTERRCAEERFRLAVEASPNGILMVDRDGHIELVNRAAEHLFGYPADALLGQGVERLLPDRVRGRHATLREGYVRAPSARPMGVGRDLYACRGDGSEVPVEVGLAPLELTGGTNILVTVVDISERKEAEQALRRLNEELETRVQRRTAELEASNRELEAFSYSVSHDLRAPLRHITGFAGLLVKHSGAALDEKGRRYLATISEAARQMGELIDDLLAFSRIGRAELRKTRVNLSALVTEVIEMMSHASVDRDIDWIVGELPAVQADPQLLRAVLQNLIGNAVKFSRDRSPAQIEVAAVQTSHEVIVSIRDNGVGFDARYADRLFGVFQRLHSGFEGTGIGLANVRRIILRHGGRVWAEGEPDRGACFSFALPADGNRPAATQPTPGGGGAPPGTADSSCDAGGK